MIGPSCGPLTYSAQAVVNAGPTIVAAEKELLQKKFRRLLYNLQHSLPSFAGGLHYF